MKATYSPTRPFLSAPLDVVLCVTSRCNFSCKHCSSGNMLRSKEDLSKEELFRCIDELEAAKVFKICVFGGEPFCREDIFEIIEYIHCKPFGISLNTNGSLLSKEKAERLAKFPKLKSVVVSFDGDSAESMDAMRGNGAFAGAVKGVEHLVQTGHFYILLSVTLTRFNFKRLREIVILGRKLGANTVRFNSLFLGGNAACRSASLVLSPQEHREALSQLECLRDEFGSFITGSCLQEVDIIKELDCQDPVNASSLTINPCGAGTSKCCISSDGWVSPCEVLIDQRAANIRERSFLDIWRNSELLQSFRTPLEYSLRDFPDCRQCRYKRLCYQGHRCTPYFNAHGFSARDINCIMS